MHIFDVFSLKKNKGILGPGVTEVADFAETVVETSTQKTNKVMRPFVHRYPYIFMFTATFGFVATMYGFEEMVKHIPLVAERPWEILIVGVCVLMITGKLYKKLS
jgi:uncharacterized integral membrane protein